MLFRLKSPVRRHGTHKIKKREGLKMENEETFKMIGWLDWVLYDENGNVKQTGCDHNQIQNQFKREVASRFIKGGASAASYFTHMKLSEGAVEAVSATSFTAWIAGPATVISSDGAAAAYVATYTATVAAGVDTGTILCAGFLTTPTVSGLRCNTACVVNKAAGDSLALTWTITAA